MTEERKKKNCEQLEKQCHQNDKLKIPMVIQTS